ncbi:Cystine/glutamate transporter [Anabarilius grahami]|uniref:Cystine/glutamate transporter n=1 Tax=Anabarilius grahami TaxID=495550 RepID=A0A3N0XD45_ANAGA|nr:Cystine/glutamate transporter [Anabarilius grahami]
MVTVTVCYVLVNVAYYTMMTADELLMSDAVAVVSSGGPQTLEMIISGSSLESKCPDCAALNALQTFAGRALQGVAPAIPILVALSCLGALNGGFFGSPRMLFVGAREGHFPAIFSMIHIHRKTPLPAVLFLVPIAVPVVFTIVCFFIVGLSLYSDPWNTGGSCALTISGIPVYYLTVKKSYIPERWKKAFYYFSQQLQILLEVAQQEVQTY